MLPPKTGSAIREKTADLSIERRGKRGALIETIKTTAAWSRILIFKFTPKEEESPFRIEISAVADTGSPTSK